jgi:hypothetical protein
MINTEKLREIAESFMVNPPSGVNVVVDDYMPFEFQEKHGIKKFDYQYAFMLPGAELLGPIGVCYWQHDLILDVAYFGRMDLWDRNRPYFNQAVASKVYEPTIMGETCCSLMGVWSGNYFHWTLEILPMLQAVIQYQDVYEDEVTLLVEHNAKPWVFESLRAFGFSKILPIQNMHYKIKKLLVPPVGRRDGYTLPGSIKFLRSNEIHPRSVKMVYISRSDATKRQIINESEVISFLGGRGFTPLVLSQYDWRDQVSVMKGADIVIGPHGAGLANIAYCQPGTKVIEISTPEYINPCFFTLAAAAGLDYRLLIGDAQPGENISIEMEHLDAAI